MKIIRSEEIPEPAGHYSAVIEHNGVLYISGQLPLTGGATPPAMGIEEQTKAVMEKLETILRAAGTTRDRVIQIRLFVTDAGYWKIVNEVVGNFFGMHKPVRSIIPVGNLHHGCLVELEATAAVAAGLPDNTGSMMIDLELDQVARVCKFLWQKNWAERNGGNISVNISRAAAFVFDNVTSADPKEPLKPAFPALAGQVFYVTGTGQRMRDVATSPLRFGSIIRILDDGTGYECLAGSPHPPTSELPSHLAIHHFLQKRGKNYKAVLHTHPTDLITLTHNRQFLSPNLLSRMLWAMIPETRVFVPKGVGIVPYTLTGTTELAKATIRQLENHDVVLWEKHGALAVGEHIEACFDALDTLSKSAQIYIQARMAGFEPEGLSAGQLDELARAFKLE
jgi:rhamnulose-1-phosphate aldolase